MESNNGIRDLADSDLLTPLLTADRIFARPKARLNAYARTGTPELYYKIDWLIV
jgi:hypothetical protein